MIISVPSYVIPGTYAENVEALVARTEIQGIELLFYMYDPDSRELLIREKSRIEAWHGRFRYSLHMPDVLRPEHEELLELTGGFAERYILHVPPQACGSHGDPRDCLRFCRLVESWRTRYGERFLLENCIGRSFEPLASRLEGLPICCDTGHLLIEAAGLEGFLGRYGERVREVHLHGVREGGDHRDFAPEEPWFLQAVPFLRAFGGVVNLEVFSIAEVDALLAVLRAHGLLG